MLNRITRCVLLAVALILLSTATHAQAPTTWPGCSDPVPAVATAAGYTTEIFCDHFAPGLPTIDVSNFCGSHACTAYQYSWFALQGWPGLAQGGANGYWCCTTVNSPSWFTNYVGGGGSGLAYVSTAPGTIGDNSSNFQTCATNGVANQWYGIAIPGASYVRWELFTAMVGGHNTLWQFPTEYMAAPGPGVQFVELDNSDSDVGRLFYWSPGGISSFGGFTFGAYSGTDFVISSIVIKTTDNAGTGIMREYKADTTQLGSDLTWTDPTTAPGVLETQHECLLILGSSSAPLNVKSVQVFSKYPLIPGVSGPPPVFGGGHSLRR